MSLLKGASSYNDDQKSPQPWRSGDPWSPPHDPTGPSVHTGDPSTSHSLSSAVRARKDEYIRKETVKVKVGTWNVASINGTEKDLGAWFVGGYGVKGLSQDLAGLAVETQPVAGQENSIESVEAQEARLAKKKSTLPKDDIPAVDHDSDIDLYVLGLQEVIDVASMTEAVKPFTDPNPAKKWKKALTTALPPTYQMVAEQQLLGLLILIYASPTLAPSISNVSTASVGTGLMGYLGNKGAVSVRLMLAETTKFCFINCHLAAGADQAALNRRIWDTSQVLSRTRFSPVSPDGEVVESGEEKIGDEDFAFWFGDLNYRLDDIPGEDVRRLLLLHTRNEYDVTNQSKRRIDSELGFINAPSSESVPAHKHYEYSDVELPASESAAEPPLDPESDPASLHTTIKSLLAHDQLHNQQRLRKAFHDGWREGDIKFLPTYKYDVGSVGMFDSGEKKRSPSWCDRILFRTRRDLHMSEEKSKRLEEARKKDEAMRAQGLDQATAEQDVLFDYDPDTDGLAYGDDGDGDGECDDDFGEAEDALHDAELVQTRDDYGDPILLHHYISHQRVLSSDHKPLDAIFTVTYDAVIPELKARVHQEVAKELDKAENESRPAVTVVVDNLSDLSNPNADGPTDMSAVDFGPIRYHERQTRTVTIANTGQIPATFSFVERPSDAEDDVKAVPDWLTLDINHETIEPATKSGTGQEPRFTLYPGDSTVVELSIQVSKPELVHGLNSSDVDLDDVLVLRVENGRDHFIPVKGTWLPSAYFRTLGELVLAPEGGVRQMQPRRGGDVADQTAAAHHSAPKELFLLTEPVPSLVERSIADWTMVHGTDQPPWQYEEHGLSWPFVQETWTFHQGEERSDLLARVRESLDMARPLDESFDADVTCLIRLEVLAEVLLTFLESLQDGVVTAEAWKEIEQHLDDMDKSKVQGSEADIQEMAMDSLSRSPVHSVSFTFITFMLTRIINELVPYGVMPPSAATAPASPRDSKRSRTSTLSSETGPALQSGQTTPSKRSLFSPLRRRRAESASSSSGVAATVEELLFERRQKLAAAYSGIFAGAIIRSEKDSTVKGKEKKALEARKQRVMQSFLDARHI
ncbi:hypothetical protein PV10_05375 [Exophiala mesophila]|uniref:Inositol polyphosphate-related phosphatase domain-containing protein n=1 Tax=Exophiala mesophila TaxID=212818 RepID=A0A0D1XRL7_EXOME|nr:uncharacterized protein PV10_05375 [Exophiala mesophila]KIV90751.1 hypothetical protein PV10_05375 [Exophiala mesophila]